MWTIWFDSMRIHNIIWLFDLRHREQWRRRKKRAQKQSNLDEKKRRKNNYHFAKGKTNEKYELLWCGANPFPSFFLPYKSKNIKSNQNYIEYIWWAKEWERETRHEKKRHELIIFMRAARNETKTKKKTSAKKSNTFRWAIGWKKKKKWMMNWMKRRNEQNVYDALSFFFFSLYFSNCFVTSNI